MEETKVITTDTGFHSSNVMQDIGGALEHLAMAAGANRYIITKLPEAVKRLKKNNM